jgi:hypothetical protein
MDADAQQQDELEKQQQLLNILHEIWCGPGLHDDGVLILAGALGLSKEFKQMIGE